MVTTAEAWDLWREASCAERGFHAWQIHQQTKPDRVTFTCQCCSASEIVDLRGAQVWLPWGAMAPVRSGTCLHCGSGFRWAAYQETESKEYCSPAHRERARAKRKSAKSRPWRLAAERTKREALAEAKARQKTCDVCDREFEAESREQRRCSDACREFAHHHRHDNAEIWTRERFRAGFLQCPSGKVRHPTKNDARRAARNTQYLRYGGFQNWLSVYECSLCSGGWHLTSKPQRSRPAPKRAAANA